MLPIVTQGSMKPKNGCQTLPCNSDVVVELSYTGPGAPAGATVRAPAKKIGCAF